MSTNSYHYVFNDHVFNTRYEHLVRAHLDAICKARQKLSLNGHLLDAKSRLRPMECDDLTRVLRSFLKSLTEFEEFLKDGTNLPPGGASRRYKIYASLSYTDEQVREAMLVVSAFRSVCHEPSRERFELLAELRQKINMLLRISEPLESEARELLALTMLEDTIHLQDLPGHLF